MRTRGFAIIFLVVAGLFTPPQYTFEHAERAIAAEVAKSDRALDRAVQDMPAISLMHKKALLACVDHHLACTRQDLVAAEEANLAVDPRVAVLAEQELAEYRATERKLKELRELIARA